LPSLLEAAGFELVALEPLLDVTRPGEPLWEWAASFAREGAARLVALGALAPEAAAAHAAALERAERKGWRMLTPVTGHILARRRGVHQS
jgi:hypothetical protein